jgi:general secretion pathway protein J
MIRDRQTGFTLLEVLVALVVLGLLLAGLAQGVQFGLQAWTRQSRLIATHGDADAVDRLLRRMIEEADPGRATVAAAITGDASRLLLVTRLPAGALHPGSQEVEASIGVDRAHRLLLRWYPYLNAPRLQPAPPPQQDVLMEGLDHLDIAYWGPDAAQPAAPRAWHSNWHGPDLPELIRIRLVFAEGDARHWPPIIAAPMRGKPG